MVKYKSATLDNTFTALSDPTRRRMLTALSQGERSVTDLARPFDISLPAVSKHLRVLERARLISRTKEGRVHRLRLNAGPLQDAALWIETYRRFWEQQFDSLAKHLDQLSSKEDRK